MITIYLGDVDEYLSRLACACDPDSKLITQDNIIDLLPGTYYTSIADAGGLGNLATVLRQADKIVYAPPPDHKWSGGNKQKTWTEDYVRIFSFRCQVENYQSTADLSNKEIMLQLADTRKTTSPQLWIAGCSISNGSGIAKKDRYGQLLAGLLDLPVSFLTKGGSSMIWAADQILRSDIGPEDLVVWGLTSRTRFPYYDNTVHHIHASWFGRNPDSKIRLDPASLDSDDNLYRTVISLFQVINYCNKIGAKLILVSLFDDEIIEYVRDFPRLIMLYKLWGRDYSERFIDLGTDNEHPGPLTHQFYAEEIYKFINEQEKNGI